jgi:hypothetical protein
VGHEDLIRATRAPARPWLAVLAAAAVLGYAWIAAGLRPFTAPENVLVALPMIPVVLLAARQRRSTPEGVQVAATPLRQRGAVVWVALFVAAAAWEFLALFSSPRDDHPTLSTIADWIMSIHPGRAALFAVWLSLGAAMARRRRDGDASRHGS